jgi:CspA family cold shock protein
MSERLEGVVKWFDYGFINPVIDMGDVDESVEYFVHFSSINMAGFKTLQAGQRVIFELLNTDKGIQAVNVEVIK